MASPLPSVSFPRSGVFDRRSSESDELRPPGVDVRCGRNVGLYPLNDLRRDVVLRAGGNRGDKMVVGPFASDPH